MRGYPALMRVQKIARVCERTALLPLVALVIELLALLLACNSPFDPSTQLLLVGIAAAACLVTLIGSVLWFRRQVYLSVLCILASVSCILVASFTVVPIPGTSLPAPQHDWAFLRIARRPMSVDIKMLDKSVARETGKRRLFDPQLGAAQVPEPAAWSLVVLGGVALLRSRRLRRRS